MPRRSTLIDQFKSIDFFSTNISFRENGSDSFSSLCGACTSFFIALLVATYAVTKLTIMANYEDTLFNQYVEKHGLSNEQFN